MESVLRMLARPAALISGLATTLMMLHIVIGVILRVGFHTYLLGTTAIVSYFYMVVLVFPGVFVASWHQEQIRVDVLADLFPPAFRRITDAVAELFTLFFFTMFTWGLFLTAMQKTEQKETVDAVFAYIPVWPLRWVAVIGIVLAALVTLWHLSRLVTRGALPAVPAGSMGSQEGTV